LEFFRETGRLEAYRRLIWDDLARLEPVQICCVVTSDYVFDFAILYESLVMSWTFQPWLLHAVVVEQDAYERLTAAGLEGVEVHRIDAQTGDWATNAGLQTLLFDHPGLERAVVSDADNVFVAETPELFLLLNEFDFVFVGSPLAEWMVQASLWAFRRNEHSERFIELWRKHSTRGRHVDASGLPFALLENTDEQLKVRVLARGRPHDNHWFHPAPYDVQINMRPFTLTGDALGFREAEMGRAKVVHMAGLRGRANTSVAERIDALVEMVPGAAAFLQLYAELANKAARRLGMEGVLRPRAYVEERLQAAGFVARRSDLAAFLNRRGLLRTAVEVGVRDGTFSEGFLRDWKGSTLFLVDPWTAGGPDGYVDANSVRQAEHDQRYEQVQRRLAPFEGRSTIWRMTSEEAAARTWAQSVDFVYLDARHDYESVKRDLELWYDKVSPGGIIAGDGYIDGDLPEGRFGVKSAVDEFFAAKGLSVRSTHADAPFCSWIVEVPTTWNV
jgi:hypothetical protein